MVFLKKQPTTKAKMIFLPDESPPRLTSNALKKVLRGARPVPF